MYCWFIMTMGLCKHFVHNARYAKCLHRPIVIINQQYTKGEIHFINNTLFRCVKRENNIWSVNIVRWQSCIYRILGIFHVIKFWQKWHLEGVLNVFRVIFSLFKGLSMETYSRVYFSPCLFLTISDRSWSQGKLNPCGKFPIYGI